ncbi:MAG: hypothetical protein EAZ76_10860 [Nostocales cyanobacterium]|nr:MAG: hypothetical protein EAZ87_11825 [Nostocales cyanobacterium]TAF13800.1 MAG: hypothetical protein EAZ76_10860 [Nostocales cyanobacterium]
MAERTLQEVLGVGASQDANTITLRKADLGLTDPSATADKVIAAVVIKALSNMGQSFYDADIDQTIYVERGFDSFVQRGTNQDNYLVRQINVNLATPDTFTGFNPEDY